MSPDLTAALWTLPGPRKFIRKIGQDLSKGVSQVIFSPPSYNLSAFKESLWDCLEKEFYLHTSSIDVSQYEDVAPFEILSLTFPRLSDNQYLEKAVDTPELPDVIFLENLEKYSTSNCQNWINSISRWAEACRSSGSKHSLAIILRLQNPHKFNLPPTDVKLKYRVLAGFPSSLEVRLLCQLEVNEINAETQWRDYILASLAGNDLYLCDLLWEEVFNPVESIITSLLKYAEYLGWERESIDSNYKNWRPKPPGFELTLSPTEASFNLLSSGFTIYTPEYGEEIHPSLLALNKKEQDIIHRIWRAQAALLLPAIDDVRRRICHYFSSKYGENWAVIDEKILTPPLEWGELKVYFDSLPFNSWEKRQWGLGVRQAWKIRNDLAHYTPIGYQVFCEFWRLSSSIHSLKSQNPY